MSATTVKLDAELLREIGSVKPREQTLSSYVREAVRREVRRETMREAAEKYETLLRNNATERKRLDEWEMAPLAMLPRRRRK